MTTIEIVAIILIASILLFVLITYLLHGIKVEKKNKKEKVQEKKVEEKPKEVEIPEQKPVPVGIIREKNVEAEQGKQPEYDLAPLKDKPKENPVTQKTEKNLQSDIKNLSPEMKKVIMSDILKPKF